MLKKISLILAIASATGLMAMEIESKNEVKQEDFNKFFNSVEELDVETVKRVCNNLSVIPYAIRVKLLNILYQKKLELEPSEFKKNLAISAVITILSGISIYKLYSICPESKYTAILANIFKTTGEVSKSENTILDKVVNICRILLLIGETKKDLKEKENIPFSLANEMKAIGIFSAITGLGSASIFLIFNTFASHSSKSVNSYFIKWNKKQINKINEIENLICSLRPV